GDIVVTLNTAPTVATVSVAAVSPFVATMTATYTVAENQSVARLDITSVALDPSASPTLTDITDWAADNTTYYPNDIDPTAGFIPVTAFSTGNYNLKIDGTYPAIASVTSSTPDDTYGIGDDIILTLTFSELVISNNILELPFGLTNNIEFPALAGDISNDPVGDAVTVTYTIKDTDPEIPALQVTGTGVMIGNVTDAAGNELQDPAGLILPASSDLPDQPRAIVVDGQRPAKPVINSCVPTGGSATLTNGSDYNAYFNDTNTGASIIVDFDNVDDGTMEGG
ncbi:uncharacterized protein METZ01_LOCUS405559, partial [marine metagenome]